VRRLLAVAMLLQLASDGAFQRGAHGGTADFVLLLEATRWVDLTTVLTLALCALLSLHGGRGLAVFALSASWIGLVTPQLILAESPHPGVVGLALLYLASALAVTALARPRGQRLAHAAALGFLGAAILPPLSWLAGFLAACVAWACAAAALLRR
jgi:hypothetical protein